MTLRHAWFVIPFSVFLLLGSRRGILLLSGLGSGAAWLASYARADDRVRRLKVLDRLIDIIKAARAAETLDELTKLREEADGVFSRTIGQVEANKLDESALMAFSLALNQAQIAISDRRSMLAAAQAATPSEPATAETKTTSADTSRTSVRQLRKSARIVPESS